MNDTHTSNISQQRQWYFLRCCKAWLEKNNPDVLEQLRDLSYKEFPSRFGFGVRKKSCQHDYSGVDEVKG